jgi:hypothetical protein
MNLTRRLASVAAIVTALALGAPLIAASAATDPVPVPSQGSPHCPAWYHGPTNLATGCPFWLMVP